MDPDTRKAYGMGYSAGRKGAWPQHVAILPDSDAVKNVLLACRQLRDSAQDICSVLSEGDDFVLMLEPKIELFDRAVENYNNSVLETTTKEMENT